MATFLSHLLLLFSSSFPSSSSSPPLIQQACSATRYQSLCLSSLSAQSPVSSPSASAILLASLSLSSANLSAARSRIQSLNSSSSSDPNRTLAATSCLEVLSYASLRLSAASRAVQEGSFLHDVRAWASAALLYQFGCWSGFKYLLVNDADGQVADAMSTMLISINLTSNALAMATALQRYGDNVSTWAPPQTERDGYWGGSRGGDGIELGSRTGVPSGLMANVTVCKEDGCEYRTVQSAVDAAPDYGPGPFVIHIKEGVYEEIVRVAYEKTYVVLVGDGMGRTVISGNLSADTVGVSTYNSATLGAVGDGFMASNLTISNTAAPGSHQAVAFRSDSDRSIVESVEILGHQDTLYAHSLRQLYKSCRISGTVDFIFGNSAAVFDDCIILIVPRQLNPDNGEQNTVAAHGRSDPAQSTGFVFYKCTVNGTTDYYAYYSRKPDAHRNYLGRPWKEYSRTVFIDCNLSEIVRPEGWLAWSGDFALSTLFFGEFGSKGPGSNSSSRVPWSSQIPAEHLDAYSVQNFIQL